MEPKLKNHVELVELLGIADTKKREKFSSLGVFYFYFSLSSN